MSRIRCTGTRWIALLLIAALMSVTAVQPTRAGAPDVQTANSALDWLRTQQLDSGAFGGFAGDADPGTTADAVFAFASAGIHPATVTSSTGDNPIDYLIENANAASGKPDLAAKISLALYTAEVDPRSADAVNFIDEIAAGYDSETGRYSPGLFGNVLAVMALTLFDEPLESGVIEAITEVQQPDGGWSFTGDPTPGTADSNTTALVIQALVLAGGASDVIQAGIDYLLTLQASDGSFAFDGSTSPELVGDANSTAFVIQALVAAKSDPADLPRGNAVEALAGFQNPDGAFFWRSDFPDDNMLATAQAIPALLLKPLPIQPVSQEPQPDNLEDALKPAEPIAGCAYFVATQHNVCGSFDSFWNDNGGLMIFGYPLSERFSDGDLEIQYFERARFEFHPENAGTEWEVLLGRIGAEIVER